MHTCFPSQLTFNTNPRPTPFASRLSGPDHSLKHICIVPFVISVPAVDFLDPITEDVPIGQRWAVRVDEGDGRLLARSLKWVGYQFWHDVRTPRYGSIYVGDGLPSEDTPFMV